MAKWEEAKVTKTCPFLIGPPLGAPGGHEAAKMEPKDAKMIPGEPKIECFGVVLRSSPHTMFCFPSISVSSPCANVGVRASLSRDISGHPGGNGHIWMALGKGTMDAILGPVAS